MLRVGKVELGQGILTALAQIAADELGVATRRRADAPAATGPGPDEGLTAGSMSITDAGPAVRLWPPANCPGGRRSLGASHRRRDREPGRFRARGPGGRTLNRGAGRPAESGSTSRAAPARRPWSGTSVPRLDLPDKVSGRPRYIQDLRLPGQLFGRVVRPPSPGARLPRSTRRSWATTRP